MAIQYPQENRMQMITQEIVRRTNDHGRRLRTTEDKILTIEDKLNSMEENLIEKTKKINDRFTEMEANVNNMNDQLMRLNNNMEKINKQITNFARKRDIKELERMFELLNPIRQEFITRAEVDKLHNVS